MGKQIILDGNQAAAQGAILARPDVVAAYPITPQTPLAHFFAKAVADGDLKSAPVEPESEHSVMSILTGASLAGARTFSATSAQGLFHMYEPYTRAPTLRLPIVMNIVNREVCSPQTIWGGQQDAMITRDAGWLQIYCEDNQEILDNTVMAFKIAEHPDVLLPINVCFDGFYLSHLTEGLQRPDQDLVDRFLPRYQPTHCILDPEKPMAVDPLTPSEYLMYYRELHLTAMDNARRVIREVTAEWARTFGRDYQGLVEGYRLEDSEYVLVTSGSMTGAARVAVDEVRDQGRRVGLMKLRAMRPFPYEEIRKFLKGKKAYGVADRNVNFGWHIGNVALEVNAAMKEEQFVPSIAFVGGLGGADLPVGLFNQAIEALLEVGRQGRSADKVMWLINK
jgi:pyruvate ferredoxin oxidoreductase alpha subunit/phenylglyoxylate dehydrogenase alpha subunit